MAESLILQLPRADGDAHWLLVDALGNRIGFVQKGSLVDAAAQAQGRRLTVLAPGEHVTLLFADIPSRSPQKVLQAAPFMLEDRLAEDVDTLHFAADLRAAGGHLVSAAARAHMQHWLDRLAQAGLRPLQLAPDVCALAPESDTVTLALDDGQVLVRFPDGSGFTAEKDLALTLLKRRLAETPLPRIVLHAPDGQAAEIVAVLDETGAAVEQKTLTDGVLPLLAAGTRAQRPLNLLQGEFQIRTDLQEHWRVWRVAAVLAGLCLLLLAVQQAVSYVHLKREAAALDAEVTRVFNEAVPGGRQQLGSELTDMQGRLKQLQGGNAAGALLPLLSALGDGLASNPSIQVTALNYQGGSLQAQLQAADVGALDALKTALARRNGLNVSLDSVNATGGQVTGRIVLAGSPT